MRVQRCKVVVNSDGLPENEWYFKETPRIRMVETLYKNFSIIDIHDHRRQGIFAIEKFWLTKKWWVRTFSTVGLEMTMVDAYLAYMYEVKGLDMTTAKIF